MLSKWKNCVRLKPFWYPLVNRPPPLIGRQKWRISKEWEWNNEYDCLKHPNKFEPSQNTCYIYPYFKEKLELRNSVARALCLPMECNSTCVTYEVFQHTCLHLAPLHELCIKVLRFECSPLGRNVLEYVLQIPVSISIYSGHQKQVFRNLRMESLCHRTAHKYIYGSLELCPEYSRYCAESDQCRRLLLRSCPALRRRH